MKYTVTSDYFATGEGRSVFLLLCTEESKEAALKRFNDRFGTYFGAGAEVEEGWNFDSDIAKFLLTDSVIKLLSQTGMMHYDCNLHYNFS